MPIPEIREVLNGNTYPGRGIVVGLSEDGRKSAVIYFIMGRSGNSRNRIFAETEDGIRTEAFDTAKLEDPSLIIYRPVFIILSVLQIIRQVLLFYIVVFIIMGIFVAFDLFYLSTISMHILQVPRYASRVSSPHICQRRIYSQLSRI